MEDTGDFISDVGMKKCEAKPIIEAVRKVCAGYAERQREWQNNVCPVCNFSLPEGIDSESYRFCPHCGTRMGSDNIENSPTFQE